MRLIAAALALGLLATPTFADDEMERMVVDAVVRLADMAGQADACPGSRQAAQQKIAALVDEIAEWRHPGIWAGLTRSRPSYRATITEKTERTYATGVRKGCLPAFERSVFETMHKETERVLRSVMHP